MNMQTHSPSGNARNRKFKKWFHDEFLDTYGDFDGYVATGSYSILKAVIKHDSIVTLGGNFHGRTPTGMMKITSTPCLTFVP